MKLFPILHGILLWAFIDATTVFASQNATPYVYTGEAAIPNISCDEWVQQFDKRFEGIDDARVATFAVTQCFNDPNDRRITYEGVIEPASEGDATYLKQFLDTRQGFAVYDSHLQFRHTTGVVFDFNVKYLDENGRELPQLGSQSLTLGSINTRSIAFDFEAANAAIHGTIETDYLAFVGHLFGDRERLIAEKIYLPKSKSIMFTSSLRFLFENFDAKKINYWGQERDLLGHL